MCAFLKVHSQTTTHASADEVKKLKVLSMTGAKAVSGHKSGPIQTIPSRHERLTGKARMFINQASQNHSRGLM